MRIAGPLEVFLVEVNPSGTLTQGPSAGQGVLSEVTGTAKRLSAGGSSVPLSSIQIVVKPWIDDATPPTAPTDAEWAAGQISSVNVVYDSVTKTHNWHAGPFLVRTAGNGKNTISARANWLISSFPPTPPQPDPTTIIYEAVIGAMVVARPVTVGTPSVSAQSMVADSMDLMPSCIEGGWLLYKSIPAGLTGLGGRLMLNEYTPLRIQQLGIAAVDVDWELNSIGERILGLRRPCGSNFFPSDPDFFPFESLPIWSVILHQEDTLNPFVVLSQSRCQPDLAVFSPDQDVHVRLNVPDSVNLLVKGSYSLWINPHVGFPTACGSSCETTGS